MFLPLTIILSQGDGSKGKGDSCQVGSWNPHDRKERTDSYMLSSNLYAHSWHACTYTHVLQTYIQTPDKYNFINK